MDPKIGVFADGITAAAAATADSVAGTGILIVGAQEVSLMDLCLVEGQTEQSCDGVPLRRREYRRHLD